MAKLKLLNISGDSNDDLGRFLSKSHYFPPVSTKIGKVNNIRTAMSYLSRENLSASLLTKYRLSSYDIDVIKNLPKKKDASFKDKLFDILWHRIIQDKPVLDRVIKEVDESTILTSVSVSTGEAIPAMSLYIDTLYKVIRSILLLNRSINCFNDNDYKSYVKHIREVHKQAI